MTVAQQTQTVYTQTVYGRAEGWLRSSLPNPRLVKHLTCRDMANQKCSCGSLKEGVSFTFRLSDRCSTAAVQSVPIRPLHAGCLTQANQWYTSIVTGSWQSPLHTIGSLARLQLLIIAYCKFLPTLPAHSHNQQEVERVHQHLLDYFPNL